MASRLIIPFDNNPVSTTIKTASYTIPAGKYAEAYCWFPSMPSSNASNANVVFPTRYTATINGIVYATSSASSSISVTATTSRTMSSMPTNVKMEACLVLTTTGTSPAVSVTINGIQYISSGAATMGYTPTFNFINSVSSSSISTNSAAATGFYSIISDSINENIKQWFPSGTVLSGTTSFSWAVTEYNAIS